MWTFTSFLLCLSSVVYFSEASSKHRVVLPNKLVDWDTVRQFLQHPNFNHSDPPTTLFMLIHNTAFLRKQPLQQSYASYVTNEFVHSAVHFRYVTDSYALSGGSGQYHFAVVHSKPDLFRYLRLRVSSAEQQSTIEEFAAKHSCLVVAFASNHISPVLMKNYDNLHTILLLQWYEKITRLPLIRHLKYLNSSSEFAVSALNLILLTTCLAAFVVGTRSGQPMTRVMTVAPVFLFPTGHVWNQLHGSYDSSDKIHILGIPFSHSQRSQFVLESLLIFVLYILFAYNMYQNTYSMTTIKTKTKPSQTKPRSIRLGKSQTYALTDWLPALFMTASLVAILYCHKVKFY